MMKSQKLLWLAAGAAVGALSDPGSAPAQYSSAVLAQNPLGYYRFNDAATLPPALVVTNYGTLGAIANGYAVGDPTLSSVTTYPFPVSGEPGVVGTSYRFSNNPLSAGNAITKVDVPFLDALNPQGSFSAELWVNVAQTPNDFYAPISAVNADSGGRFGWLIYTVSGGGWIFRLGSASGSGYAVSLSTANGLITTNVWQHLVVVYDAPASEAYIYVNGALAASGATAQFGANTSAELGHTGRSFRIGGSGLTGNYGTVAGNRGFDGWIDEVAFYSTALSASTVAAHYGTATTNNAGYHALVLASSPLAYYTLDEPAYTAPDPSTYPVAANLGTLGATANGAYTPGVAYSSSVPPFGGASVGNTAIALNGAIGSVQVSSNLDITGTITVVAWVQPTLNDNLRDIVDHGYGSSSEDFLRIVTAQNIGSPTLSPVPYYEFGSWDGSASHSVTYSFPPGDLGRWVFLAGT